jgi:hypothetical protein
MGSFDDQIRGGLRDRRHLPVRSQWIHGGGTPVASQGVADFERFAVVRRESGTALRAPAASEEESAEFAL